MINSEKLSLFRKGNSGSVGLKDVAAPSNSVRSSLGPLLSVNAMLNIIPTVPGTQGIQIVCQNGGPDKEGWSLWCNPEIYYPGTNTRTPEAVWCMNAANYWRTVAGCNVWYD